LRLPTRTHGLSGPCSKVASLTTPQSEGYNADCKTKRKWTAGIEPVRAEPDYYRGP
jgi:hypothetical protein